MNKDKSEQQSQQGIVDLVDPDPFIGFVINHQQSKTRKETLEEAIEAVKNINSLDESIHTYYQSGYELAREKAIEKLQSLINKQ